MIDNKLKINELFESLYKGLHCDILNTKRKIESQRKLKIRTLPVLRRKK